MHYTSCVNHLPKYLFSMLIIFLEPVEKCVMNGILYWLDTLHCLKLLY